MRVLLSRLGDPRSPLPTLLYKPGHLRTPIATFSVGTANNQLKTVRTATYAETGQQQPRLFVLGEVGRVSPCRTVFGGVSVDRAADGLSATRWADGGLIRAGFSYWRGLTRGYRRGQPQEPLAALMQIPPVSGSLSRFTQAENTISKTASSGPSRRRPQRRLHDRGPADLHQLPCAPP
jgi:hypothetical protein